MVFSVNMVGKITELIRSINNKNTNAVYIPLTKAQYDNSQEMDWSAYTNESGEDIFVPDDSAESKMAMVWQTDLVGLFRIQAQLVNEGSAKWVGFSLCYVVLVIFTLFFAFTYVRRVIYMAFLTMIAPLVAMTYPIDKITDGKAQAFEAWLKEYIFNLMIQPLHLLLYIILVTSAFKLASTSAIYALVAIGFMTPAEKLMRRFFGFEKAKTPGVLSGAAGTALAMSGLQKIFGGHKSHGGKNNEKSKDANTIRMKTGNSVDTAGTVTDGDSVDLSSIGKASGGESGHQSGIRMKGATDTSSAKEDGTVRGKNNTPPVSSEGGSNITLMSIEGQSGLGNSGADKNLPKGGTGGNKSPKVKRIKLANQQQLDQKRLRQQQLAAERAREAQSTFNATKKATKPRELSEEEKKQQRIKEQEARTFTSVRNANIEAERKRRRERFVTGAKAVATGAKAGGIELARQVGLNALDALPELGRTAGKIAGGVMGGIAAGVITIPTGEFNKVAQNAAIGYSTGSKFADSLSRQSSGIDGEAIVTEIEMATEGEHYKEAMIEKEIEEIKYSADNIDYLRKTMGIDRSGARYIMESTGDQCIRNGITDIEDIATIHKLTTGNDSMTFNQAVAAREYAVKRLPEDTDRMTLKSVRSHKDRWSSEFQELYKKNNPDMLFDNEDKLKKLKEYGDRNSDKAFDMAMLFKKTKSGLTKVP